MPNKIPLETIKSLLPPFVQIVESSYRGKRYLADFIDLDYNEPFRGLVESVIYLQHGCRSRGNERRRNILSKKFKGLRKHERRMSIEEVVARLPKFITIDESTYRGIRNKAIFFDKEYNIHFESIVANILRGKGYCPQRTKDEFQRKITIAAHDIQKRISVLYEGKLSLIEDSYQNTQTICQWLKSNGQIILAAPSSVLSGRYGLRKSLERWKAEVFVRDKWKCQKCQSEDDLCAHHIKPFTKFPEERLVVSNGTTLCKKCHDLYHQKYKNEETPENFEEWLSI